MTGQRDRDQRFLKYYSILFIFGSFTETLEGTLG
jgi:hypothetical protein